MASLTERRNKDGKLISYGIRLSFGRDSNGRQIILNETFPVKSSWSEEKAKKEAEKHAAVIEDKYRAGEYSISKQTFKEYSEYVIEQKENIGTKKSTISSYRDIAARVNAVIGKKRLGDIKTRDLNVMFQALGRSNVRKDSRVRAKPILLDSMKTIGLSKAELARQSVLHINTIDSACHGNNIAYESAERISTVLGGKVMDYFETTADTKPLSPKTLHEYREFVSAVFEYAIDEELITHNPAKKAKTPKRENKEAEYFKMKDLKNIIAALDTAPIKWKTIGHVFISTGMRRGELLGLRWENYDCETGSLKIENCVYYRRNYGIYFDTPKSSNGKRTVVLPPDVRELMNEYRDWQKAYIKSTSIVWQDSGLIFPNEYGKPMHPDSVTKWFDKFSKEHGLPHIHPHMFRHTLASILIENSTDIFKVSKYLGHSKPSTTADIYGHLLSGIDEKSAELIQNAIYAPEDPNDEAEVAAAACE